MWTAILSCFPLGCPGLWDTTAVWALASDSDLMPTFRPLALACSMAFLPVIDCGSGGLAAPLAEPALKAPLLSDPAVQDDVYIIGPGDVLELKLFDAPELS
jgi:hypothetical protein